MIQRISEIISNLLILIRFGVTQCQGFNKEFSHAHSNNIFLQQLSKRLMIKAESLAAEVGRSKYAFVDTTKMRALTGNSYM